MGTGKPGWARPDHGNSSARGHARLEESNLSSRCDVAGESLQAAYLHWCLRKRTIDAGPLAKNFGRAGTGTAPSHDIRLENRSGCAELVAMHDLADEPRDVNVCGTGPGARRVIAKQAAHGLNPCFVNGQRRRNVCEPRLQDIERLPFTGPKHESVLTMGLSQPTSSSKA